MLRRALRSTGTLTLFEALNKATRFAAAVLLAHLLSVHDYGLVNVGIALSGILVTLTGLGLPDVGARDVAIDPAASNRIVNVVVVARVAALVVAAVAVGAGVLIVDTGSIGIVLGAALIALAMSASADWALRGREAMRAVGTASALAGGLVLILTALLVYLTRSVVVALCVWATGELAGAAFTHSKLGSHLVRVSTSQLGAMVKRSWPIGLSALVMYSYYANLDTVLLSVMRSPVEAGLYSAPYRVFLALNAVGPFAAYAFLPILARARDTTSEANADRALLAGTVLLGTYGLLMLGGVEIGGHGLLTAVFGARFGAAREAFVILFIGLPWYTMALPVSYGFIATQARRPFLAGALLAGLVNVGLNVALIPSAGIRGAAIATTVSFFVAAMAWILMSRRGVLFALTAAALPTLASIGATLATVAPSSAAAVGWATVAVAGVAAPYTIRREMRLEHRV